MEKHHKERILKQFDNDVNLINDITNVFESTYMKILENLKTAKDQKNSENFEIAAHTLKGMVSNFFDDTLKDKCFNLEKMGKDKVWFDVDKKIIEVEQDTNNLLKELKLEFKK